MHQLRTTLFTLAISLFLCSPLHAESSVKPDYSLLGSTVCSLYSAGGNTTVLVKGAIVDFIREYEDIKKPSTPEILGFLNQHKNELTCQGKHIIHYAFERGKYNEIIDDLFNDDNGLYTDDFYLDYNSITYVKNPSTGSVEPMTTLDFIDKVALKIESISGGAPDSPSRREINEIRTLLIEDFGAVTFNDLPLRERQEFEEVKQSKRAITIGSF